MLYLDNAATTPIAKEVLDEMIHSLSAYGNSEAKFYYAAEQAKKNISHARNQVAASVGCEDDEVIFTSGATEANNLVLKGLALSHPSKKKIIISSIEHSSINSPCDYLSQKGYQIVRIPVNREGKIDLERLEEEIDDNTLLVSIIWVNNEVGTIQDIKKIDDICFRKHVLFHSDATQAIGKVEINLSQYKALKFLTFTAHKIYGPKGIGTLIIRKTDGCRTELTPLFHGGEQENSYRAGTLSNELIVGFGKACEMITSDIEGSNKKLKALEEDLIAKLKDKFGTRFILNNDFKDRIPGLLNCQIIGFNNMILLKKISPLISASTGSACSVSKPSHVLKAMGLKDSEISFSIRLSLSKYQKIEDLEVIDEL